MSKRRANLAIRYFCIAWVSLIRWISLALGMAFLIVVLVTTDTGWLLPVGIAGGIFLLSLMIFLIESPAVRCLGCGGSLLRGMRCAKHGTAKRIFGSYTLHTTLVLATYVRPVHCPYCGMRYKISRSMRKKRHAVELEERQARLAEHRDREEKARKESEKKNRPYY
jgi:hypothetical protein